MQYLGTKTRALDKIIAECDRLYVPNSYVLDLFSGSSVVSQAFYNDCKKVVSNDVMGFCCDMASAMLNCGKSSGDENQVLDFIVRLKDSSLDDKTASCFGEFVMREKACLISADLLGLKKLYEEIPQVGKNASGNCGQIDYIHNHSGEIVTEKALLVTNYYAGTYFGIKQALDIDLILNSIHQEQIKNCWIKSILLTALYNTCSLVVNSAGKHFAQPIAISDSDMNKLTNHRLFENRKIDVVDTYVECVNNILNITSEKDLSFDNVVLNKDICSSTFADDIDKYNISVFYADPPYTAQQYSRFYHIPEVLHAYRYPRLQVFRGNIRGTSIILCLGIDVSEPKKEELDIYYPMQLCSKEFYL